MAKAVKNRRMIITMLDHPIPLDVLVAFSARDVAAILAATDKEHAPVDLEALATSFTDFAESFVRSEFIKEYREPPRSHLVRNFHGLATRCRKLHTQILMGTWP